MREQEPLLQRIEAMERCFDALQRMVQEAPQQLCLPEAAHLLAELEAYYTGGQWLQDYEMDEQGLLPADLTRGVLSQDGVCNLLDEIRQWMRGTADGVLHNGRD